MIKKQTRRCILEGQLNDSNYTFSIAFRATKDLLICHFKKPKAGWPSSCHSEGPQAKQFLDSPWMT
jgi:hypothetical protein